MIRKIANTKEEFITLVMLASQEAQADIPCEILISIAALETGWGKRCIDNNLFNIKGKGYEVLTTEYEKQQAYKVKDSFKTYSTFKDSVKDFCELIKRRYPKAYINRHDAKTFFEELKKGGYATDPNYPEKLLSVYQVVSKILHS